MMLSLREFHPRRMEKVRAARVIISRTARYHNSPLSILNKKRLAKPISFVLLHRLDFINLGEVLILIEFELLRELRVSSLPA